MALVIADVRARVETDLADAEVQRILDSAEKAVERAAGAAASQTETFGAQGLSFLSLRRRHTSITSINERRTMAGEQTLLVDGTDYRETGDYKLLRLGTCWGAEAVVVYVPEVDVNVRERVVLDLCQMDIEFKAVDSHEDGDYKQTQKDYKARRRAVLAQVREGRSSVV